MTKHLSTKPRRKRKRGEDFHAEYLARNFETYSELISFHRFFGGCFVSSERYHRAKNSIKKSAR